MFAAVMDGLPTERIPFQAPLEAVMTIEAVIVTDAAMLQGAKSEAIGSCKS
jgi:hypothetical protein